LNVSVYDVTASVGVDKVLSMARDAGIQTIWNDQRTRIDLGTQDGVARAMANGIGLGVGIGQYAVTVLDEANAMATFARDGVPAQVPFVRMAAQGGQTVYGETLPAPDVTPVLNPAQLSDLSYTLAGSDPRGDGATATKTGSWELAGSPSMNAHAWDIGYT